MINKKVAIIGAGIGGLSLAIRLSHIGLDVTIFEQSSNVGGKANQFSSKGYRFDTGPSLLTMPHLLSELFESTGRSLKDYLTLKKLDITSKNFFEDGLIFNLYSNKKFLLQEFKSKIKDDPIKLEEYLEFIEEADKILSDIYLDHSPKEFKELANLDSLKALIKAIKIKPFTSLDKSIRSFFSDEHFIQLLSRFATYNGSNPFKASSILNIIANTEINIGGFYPTEGIYQVPQVLKQLGTEVGVKFKFNSKVEKIELINNVAKSITVNGNKQEFDLIISNLDVGSTHKYLLNDIKFDSKYSKKDLSSSVVVFLWGVKKEFQELDIHNLLFSKNYKEEFNQLDNIKQIPTDPTVYINISSKYLASDAPEGCENWFVLVNIPNSKDCKITDSDIAKLRSNIESKINRILNTEINKYIEVEKILTPDDFENNTGSLYGSLYGLSSNNLFDLAFKPANKSKYKNLYFVGGSTHPGGGIPLVIASSKVTFDLIKKYELN